MEYQQDINNKITGKEQNFLESSRAQQNHLTLVLPFIKPVWLTNSSYLGETQYLNSNSIITFEMILDKRMKKKW